MKISLLLVPCISLLAAGGAGCSVSSGDAALQAVDRQEKAWEAKAPSAVSLTADELMEMYSSVAEQYPEVAQAANDRKARVANWQALAER